MEKIYYNILALIKSAYYNKKYDISVSREEIHGIFKIAADHQMQLMVYQGLYNCGFEKNDFSLFEPKVFSALVLNKTQLFEIDRISNAFLENGIDFAFLKGSVLKGLYPKEEFRSMSDIDILIRYEDYGRIKTVMQSLGFTEGNETDHELQWFKKPNINIELHKRLIPSYNYDYYDYYGDGWQLFKEDTARKHLYKMSPEDELVYLFTHLSKHYRDGGIGLRHFIDIFVFLETHADIDRKKVSNELKKLSLSDFFDNVLKTLKVWFEDEKPDEVTELITQRVFESGSFGNTANCRQAYAVKKSRQGLTVKTAKIKYIFKLIFMPPDLMKKKYPFLKNHIFLLPAFWVRRWLEAIFMKQENIKEEINKIKNFNSQNITMYEDSLDKVGIKFYGKIKNNELR